MKLIYEFPCDQRAAFGGYFKALLDFGFTQGGRISHMFKNKDHVYFQAEIAVSERYREVVETSLRTHFQGTSIKEMDL